MWSSLGLASPPPLEDLGLPQKLRWAHNCPVFTNALIPVGILSKNQTHKFNFLNISLNPSSVYLTRVIVKRFDIWALIVMESAARHRWSLTVALFQALTGVMSHVGEPSVRVQVRTFQDRGVWVKNVRWNKQR